MEENLILDKAWSVWTDQAGSQYLPLSLSERRTDRL